MNDYITGYSLALYDLALEESNLDSTKQDAENIIEALESNREVYSLMSSQEVTLGEKYGVVDSLNISQIFKNFMKLLVKKNRFNKTIFILKKLIKFINKELDIIEGIVYTNYELSKDKLKQIETKVSKDLNVSVSLINKIDQTIKAGFIIKVDDIIIEDTIESRLNQIKQELLKGEI